MSTYPMTPEGAQQFRPQKDRESAARDLEPQIHNVHRRLKRAHTKCGDALQSWFAKTGCVEDLLDFERHAERQQLIARELSGLEALHRQYLTPLTTETVSRAEVPENKGSKPHKNRSGDREVGAAHAGGD